MSHQAKLETMMLVASCIPGVVFLIACYAKRIKPYASGAVGMLIGGPAGMLTGLALGHIARFVLLVLLCVSASAAPLPPFPIVKRPAPLLSPKAIAISSGAMKGSPMFRFTPAGGYDVPCLAPTLPPTFQTNLTITQIDGSEVQRDLSRVIAKQRAGKGIRVEYTDGVPSSTGTWEFLADWGPQVEEQIIVTERYTDPAFRPQARFFRVVEYNGTALRVASGSPVRLNPAIRELRSFRIIVPKK